MKHLEKRHLREKLIEKLKVLSMAQNDLNDFYKRAYQRAIRISQIYGDTYNTNCMQNVTFNFNESTNDIHPVFFSFVTIQDGSSHGYETFTYCMTWEEFSMTEDEFEQYCIEIELEKQESVQNIDTPPPPPPPPNRSIKEWEFPIPPKKA